MIRENAEPLAKLWKWILRNRGSLLTCVLLLVLLFSLSGLVGVYKRDYIAEYQLAFALPYAVVAAGALIGLGMRNGTGGKNEE